MSIPIDGQNGQNVSLSNQETRALARLGVSPGDLALPAAGLVLSEQQQEFVEAFVKTGGDHAAAATMAEYPEPAKDGRALLRLPSIQAAVRREQAHRVARLVHQSDRVLGDLLENPNTDAKVQIAATRIVYERAGILKRAQLDAEREAGGQGALAGLSVQELERTILEAETRIAAASQPAVIDITPTEIAPHSAPIAPRSSAPPADKGPLSAIPDITDTVSSTQGEG